MWMPTCTFPPGSRVTENASSTSVVVMSSIENAATWARGSPAAGRSAAHPFRQHRLATFGKVLEQEAPQVVVANVFERTAAQKKLRRTYAQLLSRLLHRFRFDAASVGAIEQGGQA